MPGYRTKQERIAIAGVADLVIRSLLDRQQFADADGAAERLGISSAGWPLFGLLWPSGAQLAARLALRPVTPAKESSRSAAAWRSPAWSRTGAAPTSRRAIAIRSPRSFLGANLRLNGLVPMKYLHGDWASAVDPDDAHEGVARAVAGGRFDLIVGSDILYERDVGGELAGFIGRHAEAACEVWVVDPDRGNRPAFNRRMADAGFDLSEERLDDRGDRERRRLQGPPAGLPP